MEYVVINEETFAVDTSEQIAVALAALRAAGDKEVAVWVAPQATLEDAEEVGFEGAYANGRKLFA